MKIGPKRKKHRAGSVRKAEDPDSVRGVRPDSNPAHESGSGHLIFGISPVLEALRANNRRIEKIIFAGGGREKRLEDVFHLARQSGVRVQESTREKLSTMLEADVNHQGIVAFVSAADYFDADQLIDKVASTEGSLTVILDGVEDPRNLGALLRVAECAGVDAVFLPERRAAGLTGTVAKASAGAVEHVNIAKVANINRLIEQLKKRNIWVIGSSGGAVTDYDDWDWTQSTALVLGGEGKGLHRLTAEKCDVLVKIPMHGKIESLNVSVAAGVILFEAVRRRKK